MSLALARRVIVCRSPDDLAPSGAVSAGDGPSEAGLTPAAAGGEEEEAGEEEEEKEEEEEC
ncbi:hypothetical protein [Streptomyces nigrescens]|uniref:hypothetical protein n=1 Tax=Streptomyces nigrescens TaxID=1920 RepID=UPI00347F2CE0